MAKTPRVVYLEDLEKPAEVKEDAAQSSASQPAKAEPAKSDASERKTQTGATKRQRTLMDMMGGKSAVVKAPPAKKARAGLSSNPSLNSIPFSLSEFQSTLSDEEKELLALECKTMGMSW